MSKVKTCPICKKEVNYSEKIYPSNENTLRNFFMLDCSNCGLVMISYESKQALYNKWNTRLDESNINKDQAITEIDLYLKQYATWHEGFGSKPTAKHPNEVVDKLCEVPVGVTKRKLRELFTRKFLGVSALREEFVEDRIKELLGEIHDTYKG